MWKNLINAIGQFWMSEQVVATGAPVPGKMDVGTTESRPVGLIGIWGFADDPNVVQAVQAAAAAAYPIGGKSAAPAPAPAPVKP